MSKDKTQEISRASLLKEQVQILYMQAPYSNVAVILVPILFYYILYDEVDNFRMVVWIFLMSSFALSRLWLWREYSIAPESQSLTYWINKYTLSTFFGGIFWALIYLFIDVNVDLSVLGALFMLYFGMNVAAYSILSIHLKAYFFYTLPSTMLFMYMLSGFNNQVHNMMSVAAIIFYVMMVMFAVKTNKKLVEMISLKIKNTGLVEELKNEVTLRDKVVANKTSELVRLNQALLQSQEQLINVIQGANLGYWDWNYQTGTLEVNERWLEILGLKRSDIKNNFSDWAERVHPDDKEWVQSLIQTHIKNRTPYVVDFRMKHKLGHWIWIEGSGSVVEYDNNEAIRLCGTHQEISNRKSLQQKLEFQATHDTLTGLLNRAELWKRLDIEISRARRHHHSLSIFMIDLDYFKRINDEYGHTTGDLVLETFSRLLKEEVRQTDIPSRYGGEEFMVILPETLSDQAMELAERLRVAVENKVIHVENSIIKITISIGVASIGENTINAGELVDTADRALYMAKENGRNCIELIDDLEPVDN